MASFATVLFAGLLYCVTKEYVKLTKQMLDAQIEPVIDLDPSFTGSVRITNNGSVPIVKIRTTSRAYARHASGRALLIPNQGASPLIIKWPQRLGPTEDLIFQLRETVAVVSEMRTTIIQEEERIAQNKLEGRGPVPSYEIIVEASYQREGDLKRFKQTLHLMVDWLDDGKTPFLTDATALELHRL